MRIVYVFLAALVAASLSVSAEEQPSSLDACILAEFAKAEESASVSEIKAKCRDHEGTLGETLREESLAIIAAEESVVTRRRLLTADADANPFTILPHKPNYLIMTYNDDPNEEPYDLDSNEEVAKEEAKLQISLQIPLVHELFGTSTSLTAAYSQQSWWQVTNDDVSSPFRETNYEPEIWLDWWGLEYDFFGIKGSNLRFALNHESNGRGESLSRSWNRIYMSTVWEAGNLVVVPRVWYRLPEDDKDHPGDPDGDDNPNIERYMGYGDLNMAYKYGNHTFSMLVRNNLKSENKGAVELGWSFPFTNNLRGYVQYFNGYGESLIDYDVRTERIGVGVQLTDWLY